MGFMNAVDESGLAAPVRYADLDGAMHWLCEAFGFEIRQIVKGVHAIGYAELGHHEGSIILAPEGEGLFGRRQLTISGIGSIEAHAERAIRAGALMTRDVERIAGGRSHYACLDYENVCWRFVSGRSERPGRRHFSYPNWRMDHKPAAMPRSAPLTDRAM